MKSSNAAEKTGDQTADDRVAFTKRNWTGRFLRAEVNYGDFQRIMGKIQTWDQWLPAWAEKAAEFETLAEAAEKRGARHTARKRGDARPCAGTTASSTGSSTSTRRCTRNAG